MRTRPPSLKVCVTAPMLRGYSILLAEFYRIFNGEGDIVIFSARASDFVFAKKGWAGSRWGWALAGSVRAPMIPPITTTTAMSIIWIISGVS